VPNQAYQARVAVEAQANGEKVLGHGEEVTFHTPVVAVQIPGLPSASFVATQTAVLSANLNPEHTTTITTSNMAPALPSMAARRS
jgi:hypothetical protein